MDILYGKNPVLEALRAGRPVRKLVVATGTREEVRLREILSIAADRAIPVEQAQRRRLDDIAHTEHHQGIAGYFHARPPLHLDDLLASARHPGLLLALDGIQDPQNLGALTRTADAAGVDGIVVTRDRATGVTAAAAKASAGATEWVPVCTVPNLAQALTRIGDAGYWRVGLAAEAEQRYDAFDYTSPTALVVGAEGTGLRELTRQRCDVLVSLPMLGRVGSLNAGVAGGVLLYEAGRQRGFAVRSQ
jgi:23S rRNA (guanosine2251-2'-O)-methyltransferase